MSKHSKGPWKVDDDEMYIVDANGNHVAQLGDYGEIRPWREFQNRDGNTPLLIAAPDLLAACEAMVQILGHQKPTAIGAQVMLMAQAAISKAEGKAVSA